MKFRHGIFGNYTGTRASLVAQLEKNVPTIQETQVQSLGWEDSLEKEMTTHSSLENPVHYILPGSSLQGILQARIVKWVVISFSRESSQSEDLTQVSHIAGRFFTV